MVEDVAKLRRWALWIALLCVAALLRLPAPDWDAGIAAHPDERFLVGVVETTPLWRDPTRASADFPYGHLPVYIARFIVAAAPGHDPLYALRLLSALCGVLWVAVTGRLGQQVAGRRAGLLAAALLAVAPFPIQQAHFYTVDPWGALLVTAALLTILRRHWRSAGALAGLALACKLSLIWVLVPLVWAAWPRRPYRPRPFRPLFQAASAFLLAFGLAAPWAILRPVAAWRGPLIQAGMAAGRFVFPYTRQYAGTLPFVYPLAQLALWGLGPVVATGGVWGLFQAARRWRRLTPAQRVLWVWTAGFFGVTAGLYVKYPRYLLPLYPAWSVWACVALYPPWHAAGGCERDRQRWAPALCLLLPTAVLGLAQFSVYAQLHPWAAASRWLYAHLLPGETLAVEQWDHPLPVPLPEGDPAHFTQHTLPVFAAPSAERRRVLAQATEVDVIVLASRRGYSVLARDPVLQAWYRDLLATREVRSFTRCPRLGPLALVDDPLADAGLDPPLTLAARCGTRYALRLPRLDESFRVYDAPLTLLLLRTRSE